MVRVILWILVGILARAILDLVLIHLMALDRGRIRDVRLLGKKIYFSRFLVSLRKIGVRRYPLLFAVGLHNPMLLELRKLLQLRVHLLSLRSLVVTCSLRNITLSSLGDLESGLKIKILVWFLRMKVPGARFRFEFFSWTLLEVLNCVLRFNVPLVMAERVVSPRSWLHLILAEKWLRSLCSLFLRCCRWNWNIEI